MPQSLSGGYEPHATTMNCMDESFHVDLFYPRNNPTQRLKLMLMDVRAANDIEVGYDFDRDGWVIFSDLENPANPTNLDEHTPELKEVAFIPAWPAPEGERY